MTPEEPPRRHRAVAADILLMSLWCGLATGLVEGLSFLLFQKLKWLGWTMAIAAVSVEIVWISALFDALLFVALGTVLAAGSRLFPRLPAMRVSVFLFAFVGFFDWIALNGRIRHRSELLLAAGLATAVTRWFRKHQAGVLRNSRTILLWVATITVLSGAGIQGALWIRERHAAAHIPQARPGAPSVLIIVLDTLRADHLSGYGYQRSTSPNLDRFAREGVVFENAFSASSWTLPSHASLLTGRYPHDHGAELNGLDGRAVTLSEVMQARGYLTGAFSGNTIYFTRSQGFGRGFIHFEDYFHSLSDMAARTLYGRLFEWFVWRQFLGFEDFVARKRAADINRSVVRWIEPERAAPFFIFVNYFDLHDPYLPPQPFRHKFSERPDPGGIINSFMFRLRPQMTPAQLQGEIDAYDGAIAYADYHVGELIARMQQREKNLLVVITSDHGESFGEHGLFTHKHSLYTEVLRVPLIIWWPGHLPSGVRVTQPVANTALPATLLDLIGGDGAEVFPIPSLVPFWQTPGDQRAWPPPLAEIAHMPYATLKDLNIPAYYGAMKTLLSPRQHYIVNEKLGTELYNWTEDIREEHNLATGSEMHDAVEQFQSQLGQMIPGGQVFRGRKQ